MTEDGAGGGTHAIGAWHRRAAVEVNYADDAGIIFSQSYDRPVVETGGVRPPGVVVHVVLLNLWHVGAPQSCGTVVRLRRSGTRQRRGEASRTASTLIPAARNSNKN